MNSTAVVIPNWNGIDEIEASVNSLLAQSVPITVIVVDNGSTDGSKELVETSFPQVVLLSLPSNLGFAGGVNVGIRYALDEGFTYIGLFNNDAVADTEWAKQLVASLESDDDTGIATGLLLHGDGKSIDSTGDWYSIWGLPFPRGRGELTANASKAGFVFSGSGGASIYKADLFRNIGVFDEEFFAYYEDVDISFRAQLAGFKVFYNPLAIAYHERGKASTRMSATKETTTTKVSGFTVLQTFKNLPMLYRKNIPKGLRRSVGPRFYLAYALIFGNAVKNGYGSAAFKGLIKSIALIPHSLRERRFIQKHKLVNTDYIRTILWPDLPPDQSGLRKFRKRLTGK